MNACGGIVRNYHGIGTGKRYPNSDTDTVNSPNSGTLRQISRPGVPREYNRCRVSDQRGTHWAQRRLRGKQHRPVTCRSRRTAHDEHLGSGNTFLHEQSILLHLSEAPGRALRMTELANRAAGVPGSPAQRAPVCRTTLTGPNCPASPRQCAPSPSPSGSPLSRTGFPTIELARQLLRRREPHCLQPQRRGR